MFESIKVFGKALVDVVVPATRQFVYNAIEESEKKLMSYIDDRVVPEVHKAVGKASEQILQYVNTRFDVQNEKIDTVRHQAEIANLRCDELEARVQHLQKEMDLMKKAMVENNIGLKAHNVVPDLKGTEMGETEIFMETTEINKEELETPFSGNGVRIAEAVRTPIEPNRKLEEAKARYEQLMKIEECFMTVPVSCDDDFELDDESEDDFVGIVDHVSEVKVNEPKQEQTDAQNEGSEKSKNANVLKKIGKELLGVVACAIVAWGIVGAINFVWSLF